MPERIPIMDRLSNASREVSKPAGRWKVILGYVIAVLCLLWVFHDVRLQDLFRSVPSMNWWWVAAAVLFDVLSYLCQGLRWSMLMHPVGRVGTLRATQAIYAGLFVNEILPMRVGEVLRIYLMSRWTSVTFTAVISSILVERFFDAVWLALAFGITVFGVPLPKYLVDAEEILGFGALAATAVFIYLVFYKQSGEKALPSDDRRRSGILGWLYGGILKMADGIRDIGRSKYLYSALGISMLLLLGQILSYWFVMLAYGLKLSFWHGAAIFLIVHVGTAIPSAPSNLGTYQFFTVVGLTIFGVDKTLASGFSMVVFLILTIPLWAIGLWVFSRLGLSLRMIRTEIASLGKGGNG
jgi:uncharacterized protein (TIRG00374 family)